MVWHCTVPNEAPVGAFEAMVLCRRYRADVLHMKEHGAEILERMSTVEMRTTGARRSSSIVISDTATTVSRGKSDGLEQWENRGRKVMAQRSTQ